MSATVKVKGLREVEQMLRDLKGPQASRALRSAMYKAAEPIVEQAKANAPVGSGALRESITRWFVIEGTGTFLGLSLPAMGGKFRVKIGPAIGNRTAIALHNLAYGRKRRGIFYGHFLEFGTRVRSPRKFLAPALDAKANDAIRTFSTTLRASIERIAKRNKK